MMVVCANTFVTFTVTASDVYICLFERTEYDDNVPIRDGKGGRAPAEGVVAKKKYDTWLLL
jgi:hypothetical protein